MRLSEHIGRRVGAFQIEDALGQGGMGAVYRGRDVTLDRAVAIKVLPPSLAQDPEYIDRFVREARMAAKLNHPNVVQIYGAGFEDGVAFMALELVTGASLYELAKENQPFPLRRACETVLGVARGLEAAHALGIVHRDLKPENILITPDGTPKLADFGLAFAESGEQRITRTGVFLGTPQYASPEQCNAQEVGASSDLYSLGVVLFELLSGRPPYEAPTPLALFKKILTDPVPSLDSELDLPASLRGLVDQLLQKDPQERLASATELAAGLEAVLRGLPENPQPAISWPAGEPGVANTATVVTRVDGPGETTAETPAETPADPEDSRATTALNAAALGPPSAGPWSDAPTLQTRTEAKPKPSPASRPLATVVAVLLGLLVVVAGWKAFAPSPPPRVAVDLWTDKSTQEDYAWLIEAIPEFVVAELLEEPGVVYSEGPWDVRISGTFLSVGSDQVKVTAQAKRWDGEVVRLGITNEVFGKDEVLEGLARIAKTIRERVREVDGRAPEGPPPNAEVVARAPAMDRLDAVADQGKAMEGAARPAPSDPAAAGGVQPPKKKEEPEPPAQDPAQKPQRQATTTGAEAAANSFTDQDAPLPAPAQPEPDPPATSEPEPEADLPATSEPSTASEQGRGAKNNDAAPKDAPSERAGRETRRNRAAKFAPSAPPSAPSPSPAPAANVPQQDPQVSPEPELTEELIETEEQKAPVQAKEQTAPPTMTQRLESADLEGEPWGAMKLLKEAAVSQEAGVEEAVQALIERAPQGVRGALQRTYSRQRRIAR